MPDEQVVIELDQSEVVIEELLSVDVIEETIVSAIEEIGIEITEIGEPGIGGPAGSSGPQGEPGLVWRGSWSGVTNYMTNDAVTYQGSSWRAKRASLAVVPIAGDDWELLAQKGDPGAGGDASYVHNQGAPTTIWNIQHNLGKFPSVSVVDSGDNKVEGEVIYVDSNNLRVEFSAAFGGKAYLN